jgi:hypothetical protein
MVVVDISMDLSMIGHTSPGVLVFFCFDVCMVADTPMWQGAPTCIGAGLLCGARVSVCV